MIRLEVENYCHGCPEFKPELSRVLMAGENIYEQLVQCAHCDRCRKIENDIRNILEDEYSKKNR